MFPIVGIGASAGGLEAFTQLLRTLPLDTGMGFVLVQHLDPDHESALTQILSRATSLPVQEITNDQPVRPNQVYVIPPDTNLTIADGVLKVEPRPRKRAPHRPIDAFFESLAQDRREHAVGVVLSGTASDGTLGLEAIKAEGGITFAQDDSAKHDSMPRSAVAAGCVDLVLSPAGIATELARYAKHPYVAGASSPPFDVSEAPTSPKDVRASATAHQGDETSLLSGGKVTPVTGTEQARAEAGRRARTETVPGAVRGAESEYQKILLLLRNRSGVDFSLYKFTTIQRRIARRLVLSKQTTLSAYAAFLRGNGSELDALYSDVLISVTSFFRNPETFDVLQKKVLPALLKQRGDGPLRCWVLGCSTGQEAYSLAMAFTEAAEIAPRIRKLQVFATDLNEALLDKARHGLYAKSLADDITPQRLRHFFVEEEGGYRVSKALREMVVFARQNLIADPPFSRMDLISCRNLFIYLEPGLQKKAIPTFHYALNPGGFLLLGASESIGGFTDLFEPVDKKHKVYSKKPTLLPSLGLPLKKRGGNEPPPPRTPLPLKKTLESASPRSFHGESSPQREADRITVNQFAPPGVVVDAELQVLQFRGQAGAFLQLPTGKASFDVLKMAPEGLMLPLRSAIDRARKENKAIRKEKVRVERNGRTRSITLEVIPLRNLPQRCFLILFHEAEKQRARRHAPGTGPGRSARSARSARGRSSRIAELETELAETREFIQSTQERQEAANEELQAANEEVQSANEELQSVNEELETSKEELESANEELTTVNEEMQNRNVEVNRLNDDLINLQTSAKLAMVLVGRDLLIHRFSLAAEKQFDLLAADIGRSISDIRHGLRALPETADCPAGLAGLDSAPLDLTRLVADVIAEVREREQEVLDQAGRWHSLRIRPYLTLENKVDGAVLMLVNIDTLKRSEQAIAAARDYAESIVETVREPLVVLDGALNVESANRSFYRTFQVSPAETLGKSIYELGGGLWDIPRLRLLLQAVASQNTSLDDFEVEHEFKSLGRRTMLLNARRIHEEDPAGSRVLVAIEDVTERRSAEERYRALFASIDEGFCVIEKVEGSPGELMDFRYVEVNPAFAKQSGMGDVLGKTIREAFPAEPEAWFEIYETVRRTGTPIGFERELVTQGRMLELYAFRIEDGTRSRVAVIFKDITERKRLEDSLRQYGTDLAEAAGRKNEFLAMLGHELRNPLSALSNGLDLLGKLTDDNVRRRELHAMMARQTKRIGTLLDQLLDIARVISGKLDVNKGHVVLADVARGAVEAVMPLMELQKHTLTLSLDDKARVMGDPNRLTQIVENLLTNAAKYTDPGGRISLSIESGEHEVRLAVRDNGIGMSAQLLPHVFEVFTQAPRTLDRAKGGLGLGLPLVERLVEIHGGKVAAASPGLGQGSEFTVTLPRVFEKRSRERLERERVGQAASEREKGGQRRILVVDDEEDTGDTVAELFESEGHQALAVRDGRTALAAVRTFDPHIVLLDLGLPDMDGYEVARRMREEHATRKMLLVAVTGYQSDAARLKEAGFDQHLIKPASARKLYDLLTAWDSQEPRLQVGAGEKGRAGR